MNKKRYQLIKPTVGSNIYKTSSFRKASKKCFDEVAKIVGLETFTMRNVDTNQIYDFRIHKPFSGQYNNQQKQAEELKAIAFIQSNQINQSNQTNQTALIPIEPTIPQSISMHDLEKIDIANLINLNSANQHNNNIQAYQQNQQDVSINKKIDVIVAEIKNLNIRISKLENYTRGAKYSY